MSASASTLREALGQARRGLALRRRRTLLYAAGIALAAAMLASGVVVADGLGRGFDRAVAASDLPDLIIRFNGQSRSSVITRITALPDIAGYQTRYEATNIAIAGPGGNASDDAVAEVLDPSRRRGYAIVAGHGLRGAAKQVLVEKAFADAWGLRPGSTMYVRGLGDERVVGLVEAPDNVGYPLAEPRFYLTRAQLDARFGPERNPPVDLAEIWLRNPRYLNEVLVQARAESFGLTNLQLATRSGVRVLLDQAAGIVIDLLVALSLIALLTAGVMLGASARAEVQRRLSAIGIRRAVGATRTHVVTAMALETGILALPAALIGTGAGALVTLAPTGRLLTLLNEPAPGSGLVLPLLAAVLASVALPTAGAAWPAFAAAGGSVVALLRGAGLSVSERGRHHPVAGRLGGGLTALGLRLAAARRARLVATVAMLAMSTAFVLLMISLATALSSIETDPSALGKRYQLTATAPLSAVAKIRRIPGIQAAAPRYEVQAADSFSLGDTVSVVGFPGNHTIYEAPPLVDGHRLHGPDQAEVGEGLANVVGLTTGSLLALALPSGDELRVRVAGIVSSLDDDGRIVYVPAATLLHDDPSAPYSVAIVLKPSANQNAVYAALRRLGANPQVATGAAGRGVPLVDVLRTILRAVAIVDGLVCVYALVQACTLTVQERRRAIAVLRACGGGGAAVRRLLAGAMLTLVAPAAVIGIALERFLLGPLLSHLAINYAVLSLVPSPGQVLLLVAGLGLAAALAVTWVAGQAAREPVVAGLAG